jgi:hypothetical protein
MLPIHSAPSFRDRSNSAISPFVKSLWVPIILSYTYLRSPACNHHQVGPSHHVHHCAPFSPTFRFGRCTKHTVITHIVLSTFGNISTLIAHRVPVVELDTCSLIQGQSPHKGTLLFPLPHHTHNTCDYHGIGACIDTIQSEPAIPKRANEESVGDAL